MPKLPEVKSVLDIRVGRDPYVDAWILHFMTENNLDHRLTPDQNATPEQLKFMVSLEEDGIYAPCSDWMLRNLLQHELTPQLHKEYLDNWKLVARLVEEFITDPYDRKKIMAFCRHKFRQTINFPFLIPSRLLKRLVTIFLTQSGLDDPFRERKQLYNRRAAAFMNSEGLSRMLWACPGTLGDCAQIEDLRWELTLLEFRRLISLATWSEIWLQPNFFRPSPTEIEKEISQPLHGFVAAFSMLRPDSVGNLTVLYIPSRSGAILYDILTCRTLLRLGHRVILALKEGFYFEHPTFWDRDRDPVLAEALHGAYFVNQDKITKNELLKTLRENQFLVISDGTRERLNMYRTSTTFARAWKESDLVIASGEAHYRRLIANSYSYTRDIICFFRNADGTLNLHLKSKPRQIRKFGEPELKTKADSLIAQMRAAKNSGMKTMFYSATIASIPGQVDTAVKLIHAFVGYLRKRLEGVFIINPAEHFEAGMDADDLMYMWEMVQRSGLIDVWRFQTYEDIEKSFEIMGQKVPTVWMGKDATYSTGCTKEMRIALQEQMKHPEMQIIGPDPEKFFRRREYGVGRFHDVSIVED